MMCKIAIYLEDWFCYVDLSFTLYDKVSRALPDMTSAPLKAPINWTASITLIGLPILAAIIIPIYAYYYDFSVSAWVSLFFF